MKKASRKKKSDQLCSWGKKGCRLSRTNINGRIKSRMAPRCSHSRAVLAIALRPDGRCNQRKSGRVSNEKQNRKARNQR